MSFNAVTMIICEICLIAGGIIGFILALLVFAIERRKATKKPEKIKKTPTVKKERKFIKKITKPVKDDTPEQHVDISSKIPNKEITWTGTSCEFDEKAEDDEIAKNRSKEDGAYSILKRKLERKKK